MTEDDGMRFKGFWSRKIIGKFISKKILDKYGIRTNLDINSIDVIVNDNNVNARVDVNISVNKSTLEYILQRL